MAESSLTSIDTPAEISLDSDEQVIVERIYRAVMEQRLAPKTRLTESNLCEYFKVGRMHARRALLLLSSQGIVDLQSNRGATVACPNADEANDVFGARLIIEPGVIELVVKNVDRRDLDALRKHVACEDRARKKSERSEIIRLSGEFHVKLAQMTKNNILKRVVRELVVRSSLIVGLFGAENHSSCPDDEHLNILNAIENRDPAGAEKLLKEHLLHIQKGLNLETPKTSQPDLAKILGTN